MITGSNIDRKKSPRRMLSFPCKVGSNHAFIESPSNSVKLDANILNSGNNGGGLHNLGGISLQGLYQFAMDFNLHPTLLPQSLLFEIFEDVIAGNSTRFHSNSSSSSDGRSPSQSACIVSPDASWNSSSRKAQSPAADQVEPLLSLSQVRNSHSLTHFFTHALSHSHTCPCAYTSLTQSLTHSLTCLQTNKHSLSPTLLLYLILYMTKEINMTTSYMMWHFTILSCSNCAITKQFQAVLVGIAMRSSYIRSLASDVLHAEEINSPPVTRKSFLEGNEEDGFALREAKTQVQSCQ